MKTRRDFISTMAGASALAISPADTTVVAADAELLRLCAKARELFVASDVAYALASAAWECDDEARTIDAETKAEPLNEALHDLTRQIAALPAGIWAKASIIVHGCYGSDLSSVSRECESMAGRVTASMLRDS